jgi:phage gp36-like protein
LITVDDVLASLDNDVLLYLTDNEQFGDLTPAAQKRIETDIRRGWDEVQSYVRQRYDNLTELPGVLHDKAMDVVAYKLISRKGIRPGSVDETLRDNYLDAIRWLKDLVSGKVSIPLSTDGSGSNSDGPTAASDLAPSIRANEREFTKDTLGGF